MAKQKPKSRAAARTAPQKKSSRKIAGRKIAGVSSARKPVSAKHRKAERPGVTTAKRARPKQRIAISHHRDEDFKPDGLRAYAVYRDL